MTSSGSYKFVRYAWSDDEAKNLDPVGRLVYRSNILGADQRITNTGGGNTSSKPARSIRSPRDRRGAVGQRLRRRPAHSHERELLLAVPGQAGGITRLYDAHAERGPKTPVEDAMVGLYPHCTFNLNPRAASIDTPLHAFVPYRARRSHAPQRGDRGRRRQARRAADARDLRRRRGLDALAAPGLRPRA